MEIYTVNIKYKKINYRNQHFWDVSTIFTVSKFNL